METQIKNEQGLEGELLEEVQDAEEILSALEDSEKSAEDGEDETAAGEEGAQTTDGREANFLARDGDSTDINTDLRDAEFDNTQTTVIEQKIILETGALAANPEEPEPEPELTPLVLNMDIEALSHYEALAAWEGRGENSWVHSVNLNSAQAVISYTDDLGYGVSNKNQDSGSQAPEMENNESLLFGFGDVNSVNVTINAVDDSLPLFGNWVAYVKADHGNGYEVVASGDFDITDNAISFDIASTDTFSHIIFNEGTIPNNSQHSNSGFYVEINEVNGVTASSGYEYTVSFDADYEGSMDIQADLTDITLTGVPTGVTVDGATLNGDGSYTVIIDEDGKADVTLLSEGPFDSDMLDALQSSISTTSGDMTVTDAQGDDTTLSLLVTSVDLGDVIDDDSSLEVVDIDNSLAQHVEISLDDVLEMRDSTPADIALEVVGNAGDSVTVNTDSDVHTWETTDTDFSLGVEYTNGMDSITLTVEDEIIVYA